MIPTTAKIIQTSLYSISVNPDADSQDIEEGFAKKSERGQRRVESDSEGTLLDSTVTLVNERTNNLNEWKVTQYVCAGCKAVRIGTGWFHIGQCPEAVISHGLCPSCVDKTERGQALPVHENIKTKETV